MRIGLFCRRRMRMSTICRISSSRPMIGSMLPSRACAVRSVANCFKASSLPIAAGFIAPLASPGSAPPPTVEPSDAAKLVLDRVADDRVKILSQVVDAYLLKFGRDAVQGRG